MLQQSIPALLLLLIITNTFHIQTHAFIVDSPSRIAATYAHVSASFGAPVSNDKPVSGSIVMAQPENACSPLVTSNITTNSYLAKLVFAVRGNCSFLVKSYYIQQAGASGIIVGNDDLWDPYSLHKMGASDSTASGLIIKASNITIPAIFLSTRDYLYIVNEFAQASYSPTGINLLHGVVNADGEVNNSEDGDVIAYNAFRIVFYIVLLLGAFSFVTLLWFYLRKLYLSWKERRDRLNRFADIPAVRFGDLSPEPAATTSSSTSFFSIRSLTSAQPRLINTECAICLDQFEPETVVKVLPCSHGFHEGCIHTWLNGTQAASDSCPVCRTSVRT